MQEGQSKRRRWQVALRLSACAGLMVMTAAAPSTGAFRDAGAWEDAANWQGYGRTGGEQHFSPLDEINAGNVASLGLQWSVDLDPGNSASAPVAADGVVYIATGYSIVRAIDATTGKVLWTHDPKAAEAAGRKLRQGWGIRGLAYARGKVFVGTQDGRLLALDAKTGAQIWSAMTVEKDDYRFISGAPRVFDGKVIIGHGGADAGATRGYVTTYDADTGRQLWRFYTVPGNPADGFEDKAMKMAAPTWAGEWWKYGGGGTVWNAMTYDREMDTIILGVGNGAPWNHRIRSEGKGDNLFLASVVGLDAKTGAYKWHYQVNPGETWDYNAAMDMELADLKIGGKVRKVLMTAPKNGFFYVIDRSNGKLISAEPIVKVNWASRIDLKTGRPVENPAARYPGGSTFTMWPGPSGAHSWMPMAFSPKTGLVYIPVLEMSISYNDRGISRENWKRLPGNAMDGAVHNGFDAANPDGLNRTSALLAWNPVTQKQAWRLPTPGPWNGGVMATAGNLVFQGQADGKFNAYAADSGQLLWSFGAEAPVIGSPISYAVNGRQYITVLTGMGTSGASFGPFLPVSVDYRTQARRVLTFAIGGTARLPKSEPYRPVAAEDPDFRPDQKSAFNGLVTYSQRCGICHGVMAIAGGAAPDLRTSQVPVDADAFAAVVRDGVLVPNGMPRYEELSDAELYELRQFIRGEAAKLRGASAAGN